MPPTTTATARNRSSRAKRSNSSPFVSCGVTGSTEAVFAEYIRNPKEKIPGTKMVYAGLKNDQQIADLTAFLKQYGADGKVQ